MIRVVVDTSVVVSAAIRDRTPERSILFIVANKDFEWVVSPSILDEYNDVLARKRFGLTDKILAEWRRTFQTFTTLIDADIRLTFPRDPKDAKFLECAVTCGAKYLLTGDKDFEGVHMISDTEIISIAQFKRQFLD